MLSPEIACGARIGRSGSLGVTSGPALESAAQTRLRSRLGARKWPLEPASEPPGRSKCRLESTSKPPWCSKWPLELASEPLAARKCRTSAASEPLGARNYSLMLETAIRSLIRCHRALETAGTRRLRSKLRSKMLFEETVLCATELCHTLLCSALLRACICTGPH